MSVATLLLTTFGLGHMRPASGTWGSTPPPAVALSLVWILGSGGLSRGDRLVVDAVMVATAIAFSVVCVAWGREAERVWDRKDPSQVVADETAGQSISLLALPWTAITDQSSLARNAALAATAFFAFRFFDILKPPPARRLERLPAGWGILVDDLFAGVYALVVTQVVARLLL